MHRSLALIADCDEFRRRRVSGALPAATCTVRTAAAVAQLPADVVRLRPDIVLIGFSPPDASDVLSAVARIRVADRRLPILFVTNDGSESTMLASLRAGVKDYFREPFESDHLTESVCRLLASGASRIARDAEAVAEPAPSLVGNSTAMRQVAEYLRPLAQNEATVLITGETGTGKELVASWIHDHSARRSGRFVSVNCAAIPEGLLESELFGFESGAFTGAARAREGLLQSANRGTVFLDEVGDMGVQAQAKVLRAIETREVFRLGAKRPERLDLRIVAATNQDLEHAVEEGRFRKDLFFRLNVARVHLPALREHASDIVPLLDHYVRVFNRRRPLKVEGFSSQAIEALEAYDWPGNVRELKNLVEAIFVRPPAGRVVLDDLPADFRRRLARVAALPGAERRRLLEALTAANWNKSRAAEMLHWSRMTLYRKMTKYSVTRSDECHVVSQRRVTAGKRNPAV